MLTRALVPLAALAAFLLRLPGVTQPIHPDEAGWTLVARAWQPGAESVYGTYFVDRPPPLVALYGVADLLAAPEAIRLLGALAGAATVLLVAGTARHLASERAARISALLVAALVASPLIDPVSVKGELLALPLVAFAIHGTLLAVRRAPRHPHALALATGAGVAGGLAVGMKQNLVGGLVFAGVLVLTSWLVGDLSRRRCVALLASLGAGAAVPVAATVGWALLAGVGLETLWYTVYGFRTDAAEVLDACCEGASYERLGLLVASAVVAGIVPALLAFVAHLRGQWREDRPATAAVAALLLVDVVGLAAGGSYWRDYLFPLIPGLGVALALVVGTGPRVVIGRAVTTFAIVSTILAMVSWFGLHLAGFIPREQYDTGVAIGRAAQPGDTLTVFGGWANLQFASGLDSPYRHLWTLPMRTLDPEYAELRALVAGPRAPTWLVEEVAFDTWDESGGAALQRAVDRRYDTHGRTCSGEVIHLRSGVERPELDLDCEE